MDCIWTTTYEVIYGCHMPYMPFPAFSTPAVLVPRFPVSRFQSPLLGSGWLRSLTTMNAKNGQVYVVCWYCYYPSRLDQVIVCLYSLVVYRWYLLICSHNNLNFAVGFFNINKCIYKILFRPCYEFVARNLRIASAMSFTSSFICCCL